MRRGYLPVNTPNIGRVELYQISGHYPVLCRQPVSADRNEGRRAVPAKPMNCPHHIMIYKSRPRSYRELPLRLAEFGTVYRFEQSGELSGMTRVRGFTQDDAHIFCTEEQVADEFRGCLDMTQFVLKTLGLDDYRVRLSFRDPKSDKYVGKPEVWDRAEAALEAVCREMDLPNLEIAWARRPSTGPRPISWSATASAGNGSWAPCNWTTICPARAVRPGIHRRRQPSAPAGDDPSGPLRLVRAVHGDADRAFCRGVSACGWRPSRCGC